MLRYTYTNCLAILRVGWDQVSRPSAASWCIVPLHYLVRPEHSKAVITTSVQGVSRVSVGSLQTFRRNVLPPSSGQKLQSRTVKDHVLSNWGKGT